MLTAPPLTANITGRTQQQCRLPTSAKGNVVRAEAERRFASVLLRASVAADGGCSCGKATGDVEEGKSAGGDEVFLSSMTLVQSTTRVDTAVIADPPRALVMRHHVYFLAMLHVMIHHYGDLWRPHASFLE